MAFRAEQIIIKSHLRGLLEVKTRQTIVIRYYRLFKLIVLFTLLVSACIFGSLWCLYSFLLRILQRLDFYLVSCEFHPSDELFYSFLVGLGVRHRGALRARLTATETSFKCFCRDSILNLLLPPIKLRLFMRRGAETAICNFLAVCPIGL